MKVCVQWAMRQPQDYSSHDSSEWAALPSKPHRDDGGPIPPQALDNVPGWIADLNCQGVSFAGADHYHVSEALSQDGSIAAVVTIWNDAPEQEQRGERIAQVWTLKEPRPDKHIGGAMNTRQTRVIYAEPNIAAAFLDGEGRLPEKTTMRPWSEFVPPSTSETRHGVWVTDQHWRRHKDARLRKRKWREWIST